MADHGQRWMTVWRYCAQSGDTPEAIQRRRTMGQWVDGQHVVERDGKLWVNCAAAFAWLRREKSPTYLYLIVETGAGRPVKIGIADTVESRLLQLQIGNPRELGVAAQYLFDSTLTARQAERRAHQRFRTHTIRGEWFDVSHLEVAAWVTATFTTRGPMAVRRPAKNV